MRALVVAVVVLGGLACATASPPPASPSAMCLPCTVPCTPESSCQPVAKVAQAPAPKPVPPPAAPAVAASFNPAPGSYTGPQSVELSTTTPGAVIHYTTDGSTPTADSPVYSGPIAVDKTTTIQAIAIAPGMPESSVSSGAYSVVPPPPPPRVAITKERLELKDKIFFETGKADIRPVSFGILDEVATALKDNPSVKHVVIEGHTDSKGAKATNLRLSKGRAEAVRTYLVKKGVEPARLEAKGFGSSRPIANNATAKGREENRRVEFVIPQS
jgi:outer membrane protein OmpA-like peptidoglycan-associated protein